MPFLYGLSDEKFVRFEVPCKQKTISILDTYQFRLHPLLSGKTEFNKNDVPIEFKVTPDTLLNLSSRVIDAIPLPSVFNWTNLNVLKWLRQYGYPQYQTTFRENHINGRTLLLLDASALSAMNIKNFDDIRHIAYGIRALFCFEMTKFARSISLPPQYYYELYKLFRVKSGLKYEQVRRTDFWRKLQLLRAKSPNYSHWELLERWLALKHDEKELIGGVRRYKLYQCNSGDQPASQIVAPRRRPVPCSCVPPCDCNWTERDTRVPWVFKCLEERRKPDAQFVLDCPNCLPPCTCKWTAKKYSYAATLSCLHDFVPQKYGPMRFNRTMTSDENDDTITIRWSVWDDDTKNQQYLYYY